LQPPPRCLLSSLVSGHNTCTRYKPASWLYYFHIRIQLVFVFVVAFLFVVAFVFVFVVAFVVVFIYIANNIIYRSSIYYIYYKYYTCVKYLFHTAQKWPQLTSVTNIDSPKGVRVILDCIKFTHTFSVEIKFSFWIYDLR
jgi:hypothetical protein